MENNTAKNIESAFVPLTDVQMGIWLADHISTQRNIFTIAHNLHINGTLNSQCLLEAITIGLKEADTINGVYRDVEGIPVQNLHFSVQSIIPEWRDISAYVDCHERIDAIVRQDLEAEMSLSSGVPLVRQILFKVSDQEYVWYQRFHHIMLDGFSFNAFTARVASIYQRLTKGQDIAKAPYVSFAEVLNEENIYKASNKYEQDKVFWQTYCADLPHVMSLSKGHAARHDVPEKGGSHKHVNKADSQKLIRLHSRIDGMTLQNCLAHFPSSSLTTADLAIALVSAYLVRMSGQWRIPVGFPFMGRVGSVALNTLGPVVNVLPLIVEGSFNDSIYDLTLGIKRRLKSIRKHQKYNGEQISRDLNKVGEPLYGPTLNLRLFDYDVSFGEATAKVEHLAAGPVDDLDFGMHFDKGDLILEWVANNKKYDLQSLQCHKERFLTFAETLLSSPDSRLVNIPALLVSEQKQIQNWQRGIVTPDSGVASVIELLYRTGQRNALVQDLTSIPALVVKGRSISFAQMSICIAKWSQVLSDLGVEEGSCVALALPRDERMVYSIFATMSLGAHYLPIDLTYPQERIAWMLEDAAPQLLLTDSPDYFQAAKSVLIQSVEAEGFLRALDQKEADRADYKLPMPDGLAYIMYTSGSTGRAKGVAVGHKGLVNLAFSHWLRDGKTLAEKHLTVQAMLTASFSFDTSWDSLYLLCFGHTVHIVDDETCKDPELIQQYFSEHHIHVADLPPTVLAQLFDLEALGSTTHFPDLIYIGGEAPSLRLWQQAKHHQTLKVRNYYGPTENTVDSLAADINDSHQVVIGRPIANTESYILDSSLSPVAIGVTGELYVSGPGLAHGYLNQPALTAARFVANPFKPGERMYRTGDLGRWLEDGQVEFIGRIDHQVQIRGHRVEPGEVEAALNRLENVKSSLVVANKQGSTHRLDAYVVLDNDQHVDEKKQQDTAQLLIDALSNRLPFYMLPATLTLLGQFPLNTNGKVDRKALPDPVVIRSGGVLPKNEKEVLVCQWVQRVLNLERVFVDDDFFALGGDSIIAMSLGGLARKAGYSLRAKDVFDSRLLSLIATRLLRIDSAKALPSTQSGLLSSLPIYHWMQGVGGLNQPYFQAVFFALPSAMSYEVFEKVLAKLMAVHDILGAQVYSSHVAIDNKQSTLSIQSFGQDGLFHSGSLSALADLAFERLVHTKFNQSFPAMRVAYLSANDKKAAVFVLHHSIIDGMSWRILFSDISSLLNDPYGSLPDSPNSLLDWQKVLTDEMPRWLSQKEYWLKQRQGKPLIEQEASNEREHRRVLLDGDVSRLLLDVIPKQYQCQPLEAILSVLYIALANQYGKTDISMMLESHGRAEISELDLTRTLGWFTAEYPIRMEGKARLLFELKHPEAPYEGVVQLVRSSLLRVPNDGVGYGVLRYLVDNGLSASNERKKGATPQILFNYLGRFQQDNLTLLRGERYFQDTFEVHQSDQLKSGYALELNVFVNDHHGAPHLAIHLDHDVQQISPMVIEVLLNMLSEVSVSMSKFAQTHQAIAADTLVPEDLGNLNLSEQHINMLRSQYGSLQAILPALPLQEGLLFHAQLEQENQAKDASYSSLVRLTLAGALDVERLKEALGAVMQRHPQLGALFDFSQGDTALQILPWRRGERRAWWPLQTIDLSGQGELSQQDQLKEIEQQELSRNFMALQSAGIPLLHAVLVRLSDQQYCLFLNAHHLVVDGWSTPILIRDLLTAYGRHSVELSAIPVPYSQIVDGLVSRDKSEMRAVWQGALNGAMPTLLFADRPPKEQVTTHTLTLAADQFASLKELYQKRGLTLNSVLQTLWANLLSGLTGRSDVIFGTPISGRFSDVIGIEEHIGLFSNTVPVRVRLQPELTLWQQMQQVQNEQVGLLEHDGLGLAEIQRLGDHVSLFDTLLVVENFPEQLDLFNKHYHGLQLTEIYNRGFTHYPLTVLALPGKQLDLLFEYRGGAEISDLIARFDGLLQSLLSDESVSQQAFDFRLPAEKAMIKRVNQTLHCLPDMTLRDGLVKQSVLTPNQVSLSDDEHQLTYLETRYHVINLAKSLQSLGVQPGDIVAVALPRSVKLSLALWAIIEVGAAYLPLDTGYPDDRLNYMLEDATPAALITLSSEASRFDTSIKLCLYDGPITRVNSAQLKQAIKGWNAPKLSGSSAAYLLYTSGSTGRPKGVLVSHQAIVNRILWMQNQYPLTSDDVVLQKTPCSFDVSVWEFFWSAMVGAKLHMAPPDAHRDPVQLQQLIADNHVTTLHFVPSMLAAFVSSMADAHHESCHSLKRVFCSGEALPAELSKQFEHVFGCELHNLYGPTEAAVDVTYYPAFGDELAFVKNVGVPIGYPVWNTQLRILDNFLRPVPIGVAGELYLCGAQLADGYWRRTDLCATRFVADPEGDGERMYRTGDVVRWLDNGAVEYLGRSDDQLKIRGQRIELGEIEQVLAAQTGVDQSVVVAKALGQKGSVMGADARQLVAYITSKSGELNVAGIRQAMSDQLPAHMVPVAVIQLESMPLSANGKLDRKALPEPSGFLGTTKGRAVRLGVETVVANTFSKILGVTELNASDDFFALGGHSILAVRLVSELRKALKLNVTVGQVMVSPTIEKLAQVMTNQDPENSRELSGFGAVLPIKEGTGLPIFCIHPASGFAWQYAGFARYLSHAFPMFGLQSPRPDGPIAAQSTMAGVVDQHFKVLRQRQPVGPYRLIGYSLGGVIAHGLAVRLQEIGEEVSFLGLLDTYPPDEQDWSESGDIEIQNDVERERAKFMDTSEDMLDEQVEEAQDAMFADIVKNYADSVVLLSAAKTRRYQGKAVLFVADKTVPEGMNIQAAWAPYVSSLEEHHFDFAHEDILSPEALAALGPVFNQLVSELES